MSLLTITGNDLRLSDVLDYPTLRPQLVLSDAAKTGLLRSAETVARVVRADKPSYGINTGFGAFASRQISPEQVRKLQRNLVRSHAAGVGPPLADDHVRRMMLLKANSLAAGYSGIRPEVVETLLAMLNSDVLPIIPCRGSVGASGDLAPLAHMALALIGEGEAMHKGNRLDGADVTTAAGCQPVNLQAKEGLALLNGTQTSAALSMAGLQAGQRLLSVSILAGALTVEGLAGSFQPFDKRLHDARGMPGQQVVAGHFRTLLTQSEINRSHVDCDRVQDPYAVRCMPQVLGAVRDTLTHAESILEAECNGVSDNPLIFGDDVISGGNFHAEPIAFVSDFMCIAVAELANIAERRIDLLARRVNPELAMFLTSEPGLESGIMIAHVTAAALASENKTLAHPASVDSIPTSAGQEDHVSMAAWAGFKLLDVSLNTGHVLAIELLSAALAIDAQHPRTTTPELQQLHARIRAAVPERPGDHRLDREIATLTKLVMNGDFLDFLPNSGDTS
jgi:histidine ammonia-lyase